MLTTLLSVSLLMWVLSRVGLSPLTLILTLFLAGLALLFQGRWWAGLGLIMLSVVMAGIVHSGLYQLALDVMEAAYLGEI